MDEQHSESTRPVNPRRRKRSKMQIFKEVYLPVLIAGLALILIFVFIIGSITRAVQKNKAEKQASIEASISEVEEQARLALEAQELITQANMLADNYDYEGALKLIDSFNGDIAEFTDLSDTRETLAYEKSQLVEWSDPSQIINLSFQLLIADPDRAFSHPTYGYSFNRNFITTGEFSKILQQLYENGYILVSKDDFIATQTNAAGETVYAAKSIYLPNGKKPLMLTQTNVNYNIYLIDSDGDKLPDKDGGGFASKLLLSNGFTNEMVDSNGQTVTGAFDLVPILDEFVAQHPSFSYKGAKATLALTGYNGLFGYRTNIEAIEEYGEDAYQAAAAEVENIANVLRSNGYDLAFYTYENISYNDATLADVQRDLSRWQHEVEPLIGTMDTIVYAQMDDITTENDYSGEKYDTLQNAGFRYYVGFCDDGQPWARITEHYVRQGRIMVTGANLAHHADWFTGLFDATMVLDSTRGNVPE